MKNKTANLQQYMKIYRKNHKKDAKKYREEHVEYFKDYKKFYRRDLKFRVMEHYSKTTMKCACCGESQFDFLTVDHIYNDGAAARTIKNVRGSSFHHWLIDHNFPKGFQILCYNCNCGKGANGGICPHKKNT